MKALVYTAPHKVELQSLPAPKPRPDEVIVRVREAGVCGSDVLGFLGKSKKRIPPLILGHEFAGEIAEVGSNVRDLKPGARVAVMPLMSCGQCVDCRRGRSSVCEKRTLLGMTHPGAFAEFTAAPRSGVYPIPADMDFLAASMIEPLATPLNLFDNHCRGPVETVAIFGAGTQGALAIQVARVSGAKRIFSVDIHDGRLAAAARLGATETVNGKARDSVAAILEATGGRGCDLVVDAAGYALTRQQGLKVTARGGMLALIGLSDASTEIDCGDIIGREVSVQGIYGYTAATYGHALKLVAEKRVDVNSWIQGFSLEQGQALMDRLVSNPGDIVKASFRP